MGTVETIRVDGSAEIEPASKAPSLETLQSAVDGYIEVVAAWKGEKRVTMIVNEEGLLRRLPLNETASLLARRPIVGDVVVLDGIELE